MLGGDEFAEKIKPVSNIKSLGVLFDENLKCNEQFRTVKNKIDFLSEETETYCSSDKPMQCILRNY